MRFIFLFSLTTLVSFSSCSYKALPSQSSSEDVRGAIAQPAMQAAEDNVPQFVTPAVPKSAKTATAISKSGDSEGADVQVVARDHQSDNEVKPAIAPVVLSGSSREREHLSFTSYNPFANGDDTFIVDLDREAKNFHYPIDGHLLSPYGSRGRGWHSGSDLKGESGDPIYAAFDGEVRLSRNYGGYGNVVVVRHANGLETAYSHNSRNLVKVGDRVKAGQKIALCGRTGRATGTHCHFEVRVLGQTINPALLLNFSSRSLQSGALIVKRGGGDKISAQRQGGGSLQESIARAVPPDNGGADGNNVGVSSVSGTAGASAKQMKTASANAKTASATTKYHTIVKGDTLYALALKYKTTVKSICALNNMSQSTLLQLGRKLRIN